jgi:hypothetical protein
MRISMILCWRRDVSWLSSVRIVQSVVKIKTLRIFRQLLKRNNKVPSCDNAYELYKIYYTAYTLTTILIAGRGLPVIITINIRR